MGHVSLRAALSYQPPRLDRDRALAEALLQLVVPRGDRADLRLTVSYEGVSNQRD
jgi:hypothetical protein